MGMSLIAGGDRTVSVQQRGGETHSVLETSNTTTTTNGTVQWYEPEPLSQYMRLAFNSVVATLVLFVAVKFLLMVRDDVNYKLDELKLRELQRIMECQIHYRDNKCAVWESVPPLLQEKCRLWGQCIAGEDSLAINRHSAKLWAQTLAEVVNSFVESISVRSLTVLLTTSCSIIIVTNLAFGSYRVVHYSK
ncbi:Brr6p KNAG_0D02980 [Huiozyma naganishii CBS 8797]|uniref:Brl1/Brr6 domain-containing protein n=1 Tax=Huiozyma naganishii (strain ATCC MYA-139 / BCRC 22969 / CBS 8797 / KCTC 17520 / NBRC 10181 / NCYC 3082 / Yp74L-3) TaxID=1071383 RepID=J7RY51_HUIN7|nr:hypothetical protein KNAG_0D02980 [Kazachstania naganishii CBS 8797]CCK70047.1 hypothetical protein KNAG_0D02980 [Kazachstania naganishii CBS 8797]